MAKRKKNPRRTSAQTTVLVRELAADGVVVYRDLVSIKARKRKGARTVYEHRYSTPGLRVFGLADGSILIPRGGQRLWGVV